MSTETRITVGCVIVCKSSRTQDDIDLDSRLKALFPKSKAFQLIQAESVGRAVDGGVFE